MDIKECRRRLQDKVWLLHPTNAEGIVDYMIANIALEDLRKYLLTATNDTLLKLFEGANRLQKILDFSKESEEPLFGLFHPFDQIGPQKQYQFPSRSYSQSQVLQAPLHPIGPTGAFQKPYSKPFGDHSQSLSILDDVTRSHYQCASTNFDGYPSNAKVQTKPSHFHFSFGNCKYGGNCRFSHVSGYPEINNMRQVHHLGSLQMLEMEIRDLLALQPSSQLPVEHLQKMYLETYLKPLEIEGFHTDGQKNRKAGCGLTDLLMQLNTIRVIERQGRHYVVLVKDAPKYFTHGFESVMPPADSDSNKIYITFNHTSTFTHTDVQNYFSQYGAVSDVRLSGQERRMHGHVRFLDPGTAKQIISQRGPHFIRGNEVRVKAFRKKHELDRREVSVDAVGEQLSILQVINEVELSHVPNRLDEASADQEDFLIANLISGNTAESSGVPNRWGMTPETNDGDDFGLPDDLGI